MKKNKILAFSLVELMFVLLIANGILLAMFKLYWTVREQHKTLAEQQQQLQEGVLLAFWLRQQIQLGGYWGCREYSVYKHELKLLSSLPLNGVQLVAKESALLPASIQKRMKSASKAILLNYLQPLKNAVIKKPLSSAPIMHSMMSLGLTEGETLLISDCHGIQRVRIKSISHKGTRFHLSSALSVLPDKGMVIGYLHQEIFYLAKSKHGHATLYRYNNGRSEAISSLLNNWEIELKNDLAHLILQFRKNETALFTVPLVMRLKKEGV